MSVANLVGQKMNLLQVFSALFIGVSMLGKCGSLSFTYNCRYGVRKSVIFECTAVVPIIPVFINSATYDS